jgi:hypothetical protein
LEHNGRPPRLPSERFPLPPYGRRVAGKVCRARGQFTWPPRRRSCPSGYRCVPIDRRRPQCSSPTKLGVRSSEYSKGDQPAGRSTHRRPHWSTNKGGTSAATALSQNKPTVTEALRYAESDNHQARRDPISGRASFFELLKMRGNQISLRLWHDVAVLLGADQHFEYINCQPCTGLIGLFD